jgi:plastocyanin
VTRHLTPFLPLVLAASLCGCGGSKAAQQTPSPYAMLHPVVVSHPGGNPDALYVPNPIRIRVGQTITWTNHDNEAHDVTAESGVFNSGPIAFHASFRWRALSPGRYAYFCTLHPEMHGVIVVTR